MAEEKHLVLVVDDEPIIRDALSFDLEEAGFDVITAESGSAAIDILKQRSVDAVVSDIRMPDGDGVTLLNRIKEENAFTPVVLFISGQSDLTLEEAMDKGAEALLSKPMGAVVLADVLRNALTPKSERWNRSAERVEVELTVELTFSGLGSAVTTKALNIARGGMFVKLEDEFPDRDSDVDFLIAFESGDMKKIEGVGKVRWIRTHATEDLQPGAGIEFIELSDECRTEIIELISIEKSKAYIPKT